MLRLYDRIKKGEVYLIAEMSANHAGKLDNALKIVKESAKAGADCLKIQTYTADTLTLDCDNEYFKIKGGLWNGRKLHELYKSANTPWEWHEAIKKECEANNIDFLSTPFDNTAVDFLESLRVEAYKIASFELVDIPLIEYTASKGKPMIISCGMATKEEIFEAVEACHRFGNEQIVLLKCCSTYPAKYEDMRLANIKDMQESFKLPIGLSDHSEGSLAAIIATSMGASVIEKHVCLSKSIKSADSEFSMEMQEFAEMVKAVRNTATIIGKPSYELTANEKSSTIFRRSLFAVKDIKEGELFTKDNIRSIRPGNGIKPKYLNDLLNTPAKQYIKRGTPITEDLLKN